MLQGSNKLYFIEGGNTKVTEAYNPSASTWSGFANTPYKVNEGSAAAIDENDDIWLAKMNEFGSGVSQTILAVEYVADDQIYIGGNFTTGSGNAGQYIQMWNGVQLGRAGGI